MVFGKKQPSQGVTSSPQTQTQGTGSQSLFAEGLSPVALSLDFGFEPEPTTTLPKTTAAEPLAAETVAPAHPDDFQHLASSTDDFMDLSLTEAAIAPPWQAPPPDTSTAGWSNGAMAPFPTPEDFTEQPQMPEALEYGTDLQDFSAHLPASAAVSFETTDSEAPNFDGTDFYAPEFDGTDSDVPNFNAPDFYTANLVEAETTTQPTPPIADTAYTPYTETTASLLDDLAVPVEEDWGDDDDFTHMRSPGFESATTAALHQPSEPSSAFEESAFLAANPPVVLPEPEAYLPAFDALDPNAPPLDSDDTSPHLASETQTFQPFSEDEVSTAHWVEAAAWQDDPNETVLEASLETTLAEHFNATLDTTLTTGSPPENISDTNTLQTQAFLANDTTFSQPLLTEVDQEPVVLPSWLEELPPIPLDSAQTPSLEVSPTVPSTELPTVLEVPSMEMMESLTLPDSASATVLSPLEVPEAAWPETDEDDQFWNLQTVGFEEPTSQAYLEAAGVEPSAAQRFGLSMPEEIDPLESFETLSQLSTPLSQAVTPTPLEDHLLDSASTSQYSAFQEESLTEASLQWGIPADTTPQTLTENTPDIDLAETVALGSATTQWTEPPSAISPAIPLGAAPTPPAARLTKTALPESTLTETTTTFTQVYPDAFADDDGFSDGFVSFEESFSLDIPPTVESTLLAPFTATEPAAEAWPPARLPDAEIALPTTQTAFAQGAEAFEDGLTEPTEPIKLEADALFESDTLFESKAGPLLETDILSETDTLFELDASLDTDFLTLDAADWESLQTPAHLPAEDAAPSQTTHFQTTAFQTADLQASSPAPFAETRTETSASTTEEAALFILPNAEPSESSSVEWLTEEKADPFAEFDAGADAAFELASDSFDPAFEANASLSAVSAQASTSLAANLAIPNLDASPTDLPPDNVTERPDLQDLSDLPDLPEAIELVSAAELAQMEDPFGKTPETPSQEVDDNMVLEVDNLKLDALQVLGRCVCTEQQQLYLVKMEDAFALMAQYQGDFEVLTFFEKNPLLDKNRFTAERVATVAGRDLYQVCVGYWKAVLSDENGRIQMHTVMSPMR
ncbi:MAG: hypothetical protein SFZ03_03820 [Candidatus Melainabacteria bacterium]|nr:hypothetical protein [Candidatus Melainabacteria bacterium]